MVQHRVYGDFKYQPEAHEDLQCRQFNLRQDLGRQTVLREYH